MGDLVEPRRDFIQANALQRRQSRRLSARNNTIVGFRKGW